jgi:hypothetical protein
MFMKNKSMQKEKFCSTQFSLVISPKYCVKIIFYLFFLDIVCL